MFDLKAYLQSQRDVFEKHLGKMVERPVIGSGRLLQAMKYSLLSGGKRLRPILCFAACEAVGGDIIQCMSTACALEMIHTYSLIHDDLPAMDNDTMRRGRPTCHVAFDEATAILAGDALLTLAFTVLSSDPLKNKEPELVVKIIDIIAHASGDQGMIEGQMRDMESEGKKLMRHELENIHHLKTGAIIRASVKTGALLGNADDEKLEALDQYAKMIGLAFQVADDILNVTGDSELMGKSTGTDKDQDKATYPSLLGLEPSRLFAKECVQNALDALAIFDEKAEPLRSIAQYIIQRKR
jgi:geranylgeranyl diphosphate synthase type II